MLWKIQAACFCLILSLVPGIAALVIFIIWLQTRPWRTVGLRNNPLALAEFICLALTVVFVLVGMALLT